MLASWLAARSRTGSKTSIDARPWRLHQYRAASAWAHRPAAWLPVVYLTCAGSLGAFVLFAWLINHWPVTRVSFIGVVNPVTALLLGWLVRNERLTAASFAGSALVLAGVVIGLRAPAPAAARAAAPAGLRETPR